MCYHATSTEQLRYVFILGATLFWTKITHSFYFKAAFENFPDLYTHRRTDQTHRLKSWPNYTERQADRQWLKPVRVPTKPFINNHKTMKQTEVYQMILRKFLSLWRAAFRLQRKPDIHQNIWDMYSFRGHSAPLPTETYVHSFLQSPQNRPLEVFGPESSG